MQKLVVVRGQRFKMLRVIKELSPHTIPSGKRMRRFLFKCDCGNKSKNLLNNVKNGKTQSCGCLLVKNRLVNNRRHGNYAIENKNDYSIFIRWKQMLSRCYNKNHEAYKNYGGRGIKVSSIWRGKDGYNNFLEWAKNNGFEKSLTIDRRNNNKGYSPDNCRFITRSKNSRNTRLTCYVINPDTNKRIALANLYDKQPRKASYAAVYSRIRSGWDITRALNTPRMNNAKCF